VIPDPMGDPLPDPPRFWGISYFLRHRTIAHLLMLGLLIAGLVAADRMRAQFFPDVLSTEISVSVAWPGAGAEDVDRAILDRIEPVLLGVDGVESISAEANEAAASLWLTLEPETDQARVADAVEAALAGVGDLPEDADAPVVRAEVWRDRVTDVVITGPVGVDQLARFADNFARALFESGITRTTIQGLAAPEVDIEVPTLALMRHGLTMAEVASVVAQNIATGPVGRLDDGGARLRTGAELRRPLDLGQIVLRTDADGSTLRLGDIAKLTAVGVDARRAAFVGDNPAITIRVDRSANGDAIAIQDQVAALADKIAASLPPGTTIDLVRTRAELIKGRLTLLINNGLMGLALVVGLLFLFLNARTALWVAAGVPVAVFAGIAAMYMAGLTLNMISLFALIITLGIVVDDAIVVAEHADFRARHLGEAPLVAAERAAHSMAGPVVASTLTTVIAFFGLVYIGGPFGSLIADIPFTVSVILLASLLECFYILPNHMAHALRDVVTRRWYDWPSDQVNRGLAVFNRGVTRPLVRAAIVGRYPLLAGAVFLLASQVALMLRGDVGFRFFNAPEQAAVTGNFAMVEGASRNDTLAMMREVQRATDAVAARFETEHGQNPVRYVLAETGGGAGRGLASAGTKDADLLGGISIELIDPDLRPYSSTAFAMALQDEIEGHPLVEEVSFRGARFGPGGASLSVDLFGTSSESLQAAAAALKTALADFPAVTGLEDNANDSMADLLVNLTPYGQSLGLDTTALGKTLRDHLNGMEAATYPDGNRSGTIRLIAPATERTADFLDTLHLRTVDGRYVPLADVVTVMEQPGVSSIRRENGKRVVTVTGDLNEDQPDAAAAVEAALNAKILPAIAADFGVTSRLSGQSAEEDAFLADAAIAFVLCIGGIYICLAWISAQWFRPILVMAVIPFGLVGAIWGHWIWGLPLSLFSIVGLIGMAGIIINDAIVLVSTIDDYGRDRALRPAIVDAVVDRFRPVFLTTATTVAGLAPLLYDRSAQAEFLKPTVITLVYGLGVGFVLVLFLIPALLAIEADIRRAVRALKRAMWRRRRPGRVRAAAGLVLVFLAISMAPYLWMGGLPDWVGVRWPALAAWPGAATLAAFMGTTAVLCAVLAALGPGARGKM
jgi:multidrug efflux pump subunit AcrB